METYLPLIKTIFADWVQLTINEPLYAGALAVIAWLLTASLYSIKIAFLNRQSTARENARVDAINQLSAAQLQVQELQQQLSDNTEQLKISQELAINETQRASNLEDQLKDRNKQIATTIQSFSTSFDLGERALPITEDLKAESLWQQFDRTILLLITRLRNEQETTAELQEAFQTETLKNTENEAVISTLQAGIAAQTINISKLERLLEEQKNTLQQQQQEHAQFVLNQSLANKQVEVVHNNTQTQANIDLVNSQTLVNEAPATPSETIVPIEPINEILSIPITTFATESTTNADITELPPVKSSKDQLGKLKGFFGKKKSTITTPEIAKDQQTDVLIEQPPIEIEPATIKPTKSPLKKMKYYFGEPKQASDTKPDITETPTAPEDNEPASISPAKFSFGKLKNLISKLP
jgi:hypothetical protein